MHEKSYGNSWKKGHGDKGMDGLKAFEQLASAARKEIPPQVDVAKQVLRSLHTGDYNRGTSMNKPLVVFGAVSLASAAIVAAIAVQAWFSMSDPLGETLICMARMVQ